MFEILMNNTYKIIEHLQCNGYRIKMFDNNQSYITLSKGGHDTHIYPNVNTVGSTNKKQVLELQLIIDTYFKRIQGIKDILV